MRRLKSNDDSLVAKAKQALRDDGMSDEELAAFINTCPYPHENVLEHR